jgi:peptide/nickel transport system permease protein
MPIRTGVKFHDGTAVAPDTVVSSLKYAVDPKPGGTIGSPSFDLRAGSNDPDAQKIAQIVEDDLARIGITASISLVDPTPVLLAMIFAPMLLAGLVGVLFAIAMISKASFVRLAYAVMLAQRHQQYVEAAEAFGASSWYIIFRSVLPNALGPLAVQIAFTIANAILLEAGLSLLGLGIQPREPSLGLMLQEARGYIHSDAWFGVCPGLTIVIMVLALNQAADDMAKRADPRSAVYRMRQSGL